MANQFALDNGTGGSSWWDQNAPGRMQTQTAGASSAPTMPNVYGSIGGGVGGGGGPIPGNEQQWFMQLVGNRPWNQQTFNELSPTLQAHGFHITPPNASGDQTKIQLPNGQWVRVGFGEGHPVWVPQGGVGGAAGGAGAAGGPYSGPGAIPPPFHSPTMEEFQQEPGLQARYQMGLQGLERSAAAQGSLLSGGTQKGIARFGQDFASNEYANSYNRAYSNYMANYKTQTDDPQSRYMQLYGYGLNATQGTKTQTPVFGS